MVDIEGKELKVGDTVICTTSANSGTMYKCRISRFTPTTVKVKQLDVNGVPHNCEQGVTYPSHQIYKIEKCQ